jgi:threonine-phosphate decarboxylase
MIDGHGNDTEGLRHRLKADFSTNVFNNPQTEALLQYLAGQLGTIRNYPDSNCRILRRKIAGCYRLEPENILVTNGSTEAFYLLAHLFKKGRSAIRIPAFSEYEDACRLYNHQIHFSGELPKPDSDFSPQLVWLGNPNNPDGRYLTPEELVPCLEKAPRQFFIVDEAYIDLCAGGQSMAPLVKKYANLVVIKSFTKLFAIPGIRIGYLVANPALIASLREHHMPWVVNSLALKAGAYISDLPELKTDAVRQCLSNSQKLQKELSSWQGLRVTASPTNYFLVTLTTGTAAALKRELLEQHGFLIRDTSNFRGLGPGSFRLAAQDEQTNKAFIHALQAGLNVIQS